MIYISILDNIKHHVLFYLLQPKPCVAIVKGSLELLLKPVSDHLFEHGVRFTLRPVRGQALQGTDGHSIAGLRHRPRPWTRQRERLLERP